MSGVDFDRREGRATGLSKGERTQVNIDLEEIARQVIAELRARGHQVRAVEIIAHKNAKEELGSLTLIDLPKVSITQ